MIAAKDEFGKDQSDFATPERLQNVFRFREDNFDRRDSKDIMLYCLAAAQWVCLLPSGILPCIIVAWRNEFPLSFHDIGFLGSAPFLGMGIGAIVFGRFLRRRRRLSIFKFALVANGCSCFLVAGISSFLSSFFFLYAFLLLMGTGLASSVLFVYVPIWVNEYSACEYKLSWLRFLQNASIYGYFCGIFTTSLVYWFMEGHRLAWLIWRLSFAVPVGLSLVLLMVFHLLLESYGEEFSDGECNSSESSESHHSLESVVHSVDSLDSVSDEDISDDEIEICSPVRDLESGPKYRSVGRDSMESKMEITPVDLKDFSTPQVAPPATSQSSAFARPTSPTPPRSLLLRRLKSPEEGPRVTELTFAAGGTIFDGVSSPSPQADQRQTTPSSDLSPESVQWRGCRSMSGDSNTIGEPVLSPFDSNRSGEDVSLVPPRDSSSTLRRVRSYSVPGSMERRLSEDDYGPCYTVDSPTEEVQLRNKIVPTTLLPECSGTESASVISSNGFAHGLRPLPLDFQTQITGNPVSLSPKFQAFSRQESRKSPFSFLRGSRHSFHGAARAHPSSRMSRKRRGASLQTPDVEKYYRLQDLSATKASSKKDHFYESLREVGAKEVIRNQVRKSLLAARATRRKRKQDSDSSVVVVDSYDSSLELKNRDNDLVESTNSIPCCSTPRHSTAASNGELDQVSSSKRKGKNSVEMQLETTTEEFDLELLDTAVDRATVRNFAGFAKQAELYSENESDIGSDLASAFSVSDDEWEAFGPTQGGYVFRQRSISSDVWLLLGVPVYFYLLGAIVASHLTAACLAFWTPTYLHLVLSVSKDNDRFLVLVIGISGAATGYFLGRRALDRRNGYHGANQRVLALEMACFLAVLQAFFAVLITFTATVVGLAIEMWFLVALIGATVAPVVGIFTTVVPRKYRTFSTNFSRCAANIFGSGLSLVISGYMMEDAVSSSPDCDDACSLSSSFRFVILTGTLLTNAFLLCCYHVSKKIRQRRLELKMQSWRHSHGDSINPNQWSSSSSAALLPTPLAPASRSIFDRAKLWLSNMTSRQQPVDSGQSSAAHPSTHFLLHEPSTPAFQFLRDSPQRRNETRSALDHTPIRVRMNDYGSQL